MEYGTILFVEGDCFRKMGNLPGGINKQGAGGQ
jgi:hypothetical protein